MKSLRTRIARLAHENPELRPHLVPLLRKSAGKGLVRFFNGLLQDGTIAPKGQYRTARSAHDLFVSDVTTVIADAVHNVTKGSDWKLGKASPDGAWEEDSLSPMETTLSVKKSWAEIVTEMVKDRMNDFVRYFEFDPKTLLKTLSSAPLKELEKHDWGETVDGWDDLDQLEEDLHNAIEKEWYGILEIDAETYYFDILGTNVRVSSQGIQFQMRVLFPKSTVVTDPDY
jgi:hypothetical protein